MAYSNNIDSIFSSKNSKIIDFIKRKNSVNRDPIQENEYFEHPIMDQGDNLVKK